MGFGTPTTASSAMPSGEDWWRHAVVYQIYPRSFADANGDGIGDLRGIISRVPYLQRLGVDAVWLSPFNPSALADGGYDIDDYRDVDPRIGTLADFDELAAALHRAGIRVIVDLVPNHTSNRHAWFVDAVKARPGSPERLRYHFRDGRGENGELPPNTWTSTFGGSGWEQVTEPDGRPGQWYYHMFAKEQPDLNWDNREVRDDFLTTLRFWSDRGVDGFRVDVAQALAKNFDPAFDALRDVVGGDPHFHDGQNPLWDRDEVHEIFAEWRTVLNEYDPPRMGVAEAWVYPHRLARYASAEGLGQAFDMAFLLSKFDAAAYREVIEMSLASAEAAGTSSTWVLSNHDQMRHTTRLAFDWDREAMIEWLRAGGDQAAVDNDMGLRRAKAATLLMLGLPGCAYLYQGEELGLPEVGELSPDERQDPVYFRTEGSDFGRDGCRVPLPWTREGRSFGFGAGGSHLPQPPWFGVCSVEAQEHDDASTLTFYRNALALRRRLTQPGSLAWAEETDPAVLHFSRPGGWHVITNFTDHSVPLPDGELLIASGPLTNGALPPDTTAWVLVAP